MCTQFDQMSDPVAESASASKSGLLHTEDEGIVRFDFPPTLAAARERLAQVRIAEYARTRNYLNGAVTGLSPWVTHGFLSLPQLVSALSLRGSLPPDHKLIQELAWREYFHQVWHHRRHQIFTSLHEGPLPDGAYSRMLPIDIRVAATGVPAIDRAVHELYSTGYLHNHARMWLASYLVHIRKVHWRVGADWMYAHLLDGDLASNHLSWQWVAGTASHKPYLFNAANLARYAPQAWHSPGTVIDTSYEALDVIARSGKAPQVRGDARRRRDGGDGMARLGDAAGADAIGIDAIEPRCWRLADGRSQPASATRQGDWQCLPPDALAEALGFRVERVTPDSLENAWLVHPWCLADPPAGRRSVGVLLCAFHRRWAWSERRWRWVYERMRAITERIVWLDGSVPDSTMTQANPHLGDALVHAQMQAPGRLWVWPSQPAHSWSQFWRAVNASPHKRAKDGA